jgi:phosphatidylinositol alpha-1,6-mannosyltransferase
LILVWHLGLLKLTPMLRAGDARLVVFLHGIEAWGKQDAFTRRILSRVNLFLSNSGFTYERFLEFVPEARAVPQRVVPLGTGTPEETSQAPETPPGALMVSRLDRAEDYKGHREVIAAWRGVRAKIPAAQLWIAGEGNLRPDLEEAARRAGVQDAVQFLGRVGEQDKNDLLRACRCFAMPSRGEGFGLVYLEALRAGRPCLVGNNDGGREAVNPPEAGLAVNPSDTAQVTAALVRLLTDGAEWQSWARGARARYAAQFTAAHFEQRIQAALAEPG